MEILAAIVIIAVIGLSANHISDRKMRSRYDPVSKPPVSISRSYKEDTSSDERAVEKRENKK